MKKISLYIIASLLFWSCDSFLDEEPRDFIAPSNFYQSEADAEAAIIGVYDVLGRTSQYGHLGILIYSDIVSDVARSEPGSSIFNLGFDNYTFNAANPNLSDFYGTSYVLINRANSVIANVGESGIDQSAKDKIVGEAKFLRALGYFNLVRVFGDVVLRTSETNSVEGLELARSSAAEVYTQIVTDLQDAATTLPSSLTNGDRVTQWAAKALLAKVHLTLGNYAQAVSEAGSVMGAGFSLNPDYEDLFSLNSQNPEVEHIFQVKFSNPNELNQYPLFFITRELSDVPGYGGDVFGVYIASDELVNSFVENDLRKDFTVWTNGAQVGRPDIDFSDEPGINKLARQAIQNPNTPVRLSGVNSFPVLRYSDVLLMFAEATNEVSGPNASAYDAINLVRNRAGIGDLQEGLSQADFRDAVLEERKLELVSEGHRWFDLKRTGKLAQELSSLGFQANNEVFPIPQDAIDANGQLTQNPGY